MYIANLAGTLFIVIRLLLFILFTAQSHPSQYTSIAFLFILQFGLFFFFFRFVHRFTLQGLRDTHHGYITFAKAFDLNILFFTSPVSLFDIWDTTDYNEEKEKLFFSSFCTFFFSLEAIAFHFHYGSSKVWVDFSFITVLYILCVCMCGCVNGTCVGENVCIKHSQHCCLLLLHFFTFLHSCLFLLPFFLCLFWPFLIHSTFISQWVGRKTISAYKLTLNSVCSSKLFYFAFSFCCLSPLPRSYMKMEWNDKKKSCEIEIELNDIEWKWQKGIHAYTPTHGNKWRKEDKWECVFAKSEL